MGCAAPGAYQMREVSERVATDWLMLRDEYLRTGVSLRALATLHGVGQKALARTAADEGWATMRRAAKRDATAAGPGCAAASECRTGNAGTGNPARNTRAAGAGRAGLKTGVTTAKQAGLKTGETTAMQPQRKTGAVASNKTAKETGSAASKQAVRKTGTAASKQSVRKTGAVASKQAVRRTGTAASKQPERKTGTVASKQAARKTGAAASKQAASKPPPPQPTVPDADTLARLRAISGQLTDQLARAAGQLDKQVLKHRRKTRELVYDGGDPRAKPVEETVEEHCELEIVDVPVSCEGLQRLSSALKNLSDIVKTGGGDEQSVGMVAALMKKLDDEAAKGDG